jgi:hypothetical protein
MAHLHQNTLQTSFRRYSIATLLQLARTGPPPFDLSKFTYDAARGMYSVPRNNKKHSTLTTLAAGVVPPLGDCAVSLRRTSGNRQRGWSTETVSTMEDHPATLGSSNQAIMPERRPRIPPPSEKAQKDEGFARFLRKHSSPTHNRVTAGGRIVPMEKRESPPKFELPETKCDPPPASEPMKQDLTGMANAAFMFTNPSAEPEHIQAAPTGVMQAYHGPQGPISGAIRDEQSENTQLLTTPNLQTAAVSPLQFHQSSSTDYAWHEPTPLLNSAPLSSYQSYLQSALHATSFSPLGGALYRLPQMPVNLGYPRAYIEQQLGEAQERFDHLSQQLQAFDAHQAQGTYQMRQDPARGHHRRAIVDHRDIARQWLNFWRKRKEEISYTSEAFMIPAQMSVQAPAYVPQDLLSGVQRDVQASPQATITPKAQAIEKPASAPKRKAIPIVRPPGFVEQGPAEVASSLKTEIQVKAAPMEQCKQNSDTTTSTSLSSQQTLEKEADFVHQQNEEDLTASQTTQSQEEQSQLNDVDAWATNSTSLTPVTTDLMQFYEHISDAMRLPVGIISHVMTPQGTEVVVFGANLQEPAAANMSDQEADYWRRKPEFDKDMLAHVKHIARIEDLENYDDEQLLGKRPLPAG